MALGQGFSLPELKKLYKVYRIFVTRTVSFTKLQPSQPQVWLLRSMMLAYEEGFLSDFFPLCSLHFGLEAIRLIWQ